ncbi:PLP-dependent cysteine synthase family protein [Halovivax gelatinilyticus]|uniref:PLP-dependent cysteine synthase family protein n=1 Tax=Halovivax gelatinilyticus TaxID=2961597 RepID=UPI0020CA3737|nr:PLP-dependent cysteine synthase family protein [Halovivax gelatinilyticus]
MTTHDRPLPSVLETIGKTPLVSIQAAPSDVPIYAKLESFNPGASVKDRIGAYMVEAMLERGDVEPGGTVIEPTAGNTGIGFAIAARQFGLEAIFVVPERFSVEKQQLMDALGARVINTPTDDGMGGAIERAHELAETLDNAVVPQQFANPLNTEAHYETTAPEIFEALDGEVGAIVAGCGTAGTLMGLARYALERNPEIHVVGVEPEGSLYGEFLGESREEGEYKIEGIGTHDTETNELFEPELVDEFVPVPDERAHEELARLAAEEGHLVASSAGAASVAAGDVADRIASGELDVPHDSVVTVFPDSSERYLSKGIYRSFEEWSG